MNFYKKCEFHLTICYFQLWSSYFSWIIKSTSIILIMMQQSYNFSCLSFRAFHVPDARVESHLIVGHRVSQLWKCNSYDQRWKVSHATNQPKDEFLWIFHQINMLKNLIGSFPNISECHIVKCTSGYCYKLVDHSVGHLPEAYDQNSAQEHQSMGGHNIAWKIWYFSHCVSEPIKQRSAPLFAFNNIWSGNKREN